jgi:hypothetical protein
MTSEAIGWVMTDTGGLQKDPRERERTVWEARKREDEKGKEQASRVEQRK